MFTQLNTLLRQSKAKRLIITMDSLNESEARLMITSQFEKIESDNKLQQNLASPILIQGYTHSLDADLDHKLSCLKPSITDNHIEKNQPDDSQQVDNTEQQEDELESL